MCRPAPSGRLPDARERVGVRIMGTVRKIEAKHVRAGRDERFEGLRLARSPGRPSRQFSSDASLISRTRMATGRDRWILSTGRGSMRISLWTSAATPDSRLPRHAPRIDQRLGDPHRFRIGERLSSVRSGYARAPIACQGTCSA